MKKILGLDLGVASIGWALITVDCQDVPQEILGMGVRCIPLSADEANEFSSGQAISKNRKRTESRTDRKGIDRYQLRRQHLTEALRKLGMLPTEALIKLPVMELWQLRADAATAGKQLSLPEIGRVLYHINQKRGYKHAKADEESEKKQKEYVAAINQRHESIRQAGQTIGQYFADRLKESAVATDKGPFYTYRIKNQVLPRRAYEEEFDRIMVVQRQFYPEILTDAVIKNLRDEIIFYQRKLKSCKHLVALCEFEKRAYVVDGKTIYDGPKVIPRSSPLFQVCKIWEMVNNLRLKNRYGDELYISPEQRKQLFDFLNGDKKDFKTREERERYIDNHAKLTLTELYKILHLTKQDGWWGGKAIGKGLHGNTTKTKLAEALSGLPDEERDKLLRFDLCYKEICTVDEDTGEETVRAIVEPESYMEEPLYKLWHIVYSVSDKTALRKALRRNFGIADEQIVERLYKIDFVKEGFGNKSAKAIRRILPYLAEGYMYSEACTQAGFRHSESLTTAENEARVLLNRLPQIQKNELRQPVVEKVLNQMINVVNALMDEYGAIDEIRIELARELKQSKEERNETDSNIRARERENRQYAQKVEELGVRASRNTILKYRLWLESEQRCFYCGKLVNAKAFLEGVDAEVEHIIPKSLLFDNGYSNKVCACRECNAAKNNLTAYDFMKTQPGFEAYLARVETYYKNKRISKTKRERLLTPGDKIPTDFIERDLRLTQYISRKSIELLQQVCHHVHATSGRVTDFIRHEWGYDEILHRLNFERYKSAGQTEMKEYEHRGQHHKEERIKDWTKRLDQRHHAIDALVIAMTRQGIIQRLNTLNDARDEMFADIRQQGDEWKHKRSLLQQWLLERPHFSVDEVSKAVGRILISLKAGKKVASIGKRVKYHHGKKLILQNNIIVPRGALSEASVYGKIKTIERNKPLEYLFKHPDMIVKDYIKSLVTGRLDMFDRDARKALAYTRQHPIMIGKNKDIQLTYASCYKEQYVYRYPLSSITTYKDVESIVDKHIKEVVAQRLQAYGDNAINAYKDLENNPIYADADKKIPIKAVRCFTGLSAVEPIRKNDAGEDIGFVKPGNNHHVAVYRDKEGQLHEHIVTFWHAVERKKYGLPAVIENPQAVWDKITTDGRELPEAFLRQLPKEDWTFETSLQQNEMFILDMPEDAYNDAIRDNDYATLSKHLYRVQSISSNDYYFRLHIETSVDDMFDGKKNQQKSQQADKMRRVRSFGAWQKLNPHKVQITLLGKLITK